jgi:hypothetical protein
MLMVLYFNGNILDIVEEIVIAYRVEDQLHS